MKVDPHLVCERCGWTYQNHRFKDNRRRCPPLYISAFKPHPNGATRPDSPHAGGEA